MVSGKNENGVSAIDYMLSSPRKSNQYYFVMSLWEVAVVCSRSLGAGFIPCADVVVRLRRMARCASPCMLGKTSYEWTMERDFEKQGAYIMGY